MNNEMSLDAAREIIRYALHHRLSTRVNLNRMGYWVDATHKVIPVWKMETSHLINVYKFLSRMSKWHSHPFSPNLLNEMDDRGMFWPWWR